MRTPIRILHVLGGLNRGGAESMVMNIYRQIDREQIQFDFIIHNKNEQSLVNEILELGGRVYFIQQYKGFNHRAYKMEWRNFFLTHSEYKIIHGHVRSTASIYLSIANKCGLKTISHSHSTSNGKGIGALVKDVMQLPIRYIADYLIAASEIAGEWLFGNKAMKNGEVFILKNAIDTNAFIFDEDKRSAIRDEFSLENRTVIGHVGRFVSAKNHMFILEVFNEYIKLDSSAVLVLVGHGDLHKEISQRINDYNLDHHIILLKERSDINELLQIMDVFIFPSLYEGLGIAAIEAQAASLPTLASDTIPKEVKVTNLLEFMSLEMSASEWAIRIVNLKNAPRRNTYNEIKDAGYDIVSAAEKLQSFYLELSTHQISTLKDE